MNFPPDLCSLWTQHCSDGDRKVLRGLEERGWKVGITGQVPGTICFPSNTQRGIIEVVPGPMSEDVCVCVCMFIITYANGEAKWCTREVKVCKSQTWCVVWGRFWHSLIFSCLSMHLTTQTFRHSTLKGVVEDKKGERRGELIDHYISVSRHRYINRWMLAHMGGAVYLGIKGQCVCVLLLG